MHAAVSSLKAACRTQAFDVSHRTNKCRRAFLALGRSPQFDAKETGYKVRARDVEERSRSDGQISFVHGDQVPGGILHEAIRLTTEPPDDVSM